MKYENCVMCGKKLTLWNRAWGKSYYCGSCCDQLEQRRLRPSPNTLQLEKNEMIGVLRDGTGVVRGLWFADHDKACDPLQLTAAARILQAQGEKFDEEDLDVFTMASIARLTLTSEQGEGGWIHKFASAQKAEKQVAAGKSGCMLILIAWFFLIATGVCIAAVFRH
jgi:hypothetical protein